MKAKISQSNENGNNNAEKNVDNSLIINELKPILYGERYGNGRLNCPVCIVKGTNPEIVEKTTLGALLAKLQTGEATNKARAQGLKTAYKSDKKAYDKAKQNLNGFVIGDFKSRKDADCLVYAPLLCLDIDGYDESILGSWDLERLKKNPFVFAAWCSPSVCGLRVLVWTDATPETHKPTYAALQTEFCAFLNLTTEKDKFPHMDKTTSNVSRLWFFTETDEVYLNVDSDQFFTPSVVATIDTQPTATPKDHTTHALNEPLTDDKKLEVCLEMVTRRNQFEGRNDFVFRLACLANEHGTANDAILKYCLDTYQAEDFDKAEIQKTVASAVKRTQHGKFLDAQMIQYLKNNTPSVVATIEPKNTPSVSSVTTVKLANVTPSVVATIGNDTDTDDDETDEDFDGKIPKIRLIEDYLNKRYDLRYNVVSNDVEISRRGKNQFETVNEDELVCEILRTGLNGVEKPLLSLLKSKYPKQYHPLKDYFETVNKKNAWKEGSFDHIAHLAGHVKAKDQFFFNTQFKKMLVRVVACAIGKIPFNKQCLAFVGKQNDGKTSFIRFLMPLILAHYIKENLDFDKDGRLALCQNLIINLDELASLSRNDINQVKTYFTVETVKDRPPYGKKPISFKRTASFFASTNNSEILTDETGNVRWLVFEIDGFDFSYRQNVDIDAVWSQAYALLKSGFQYEMTTDEIGHSETNNKRFKRTYAELELLQNSFVPSKKGDPDTIFMTATEIKEELELGHTNRKLSHVAIGKALRELNFERTSESKPMKNTTKKYSVYGYLVGKIE